MSLVPEPVSLDDDDDEVEASSYNRKIVLFASTVLVLYLTSFFLLWALVPSDPAALAIAATIDYRTYEWPALGFLTALCFELIGWVFSTNKLREQLMPVPLSTMFIAGTAAVSFRTGISPVLLDFNGRLLRPCRYLEWSFTTPSLLFLIGQTCSVSNRDLVGFIVADWFMIVTGFFSSWCTNLAWIWFWIIVSFLTFFWALRGIWVMFELAIGECDERDAAVDNIRRLRAVSFVIWWGFAVVWVLAALSPNDELVTAQTEEWMWSFCDIFAKLLLEAALFQGTMCSVEERKLMTVHKLSDVYHSEKIKGMQVEARMQEKFFTAVSHELRTPLNGIIGLSDSMLAQHERQNKSKDTPATASQTAVALKGKGSKPPDI